ncbi:HlyD family secretion protein [Nonomuraea muscovyensis]|uniref:HlyD family secretion protein n=1 Tax=Nonomuraea muscovyensis TaxID=1124761 RepID=A0A7X0BVN0_9ACTN|nr:efflux RND transporter periplasmic adaptor subunit [Nonomuraea muscovyensis]MBB6343582.1 HlyD family secretion protein [Nonomuraea muscovyensis]
MRPTFRPRALTLGGLALSVLVAGSGLAFVLRDDAPSPVQVRLAAARRGAVTASVTAAGSTIEGSRRDLGFGGAGTVTKVYVRAGDRVRAGQVLARIDGRAAREDHVAAAADLAAAEESLESASAAPASCPPATPSSGASPGGQAAGAGQPATSRPAAASTGPAHGIAGGVVGSVAAGRLAGPVAGSPVSSPLVAPSVAPSGSPSGYPSAGTATPTPTGLDPGPTATVTATVTVTATATVTVTAGPGGAPPYGEEPHGGEPSPTGGPARTPGRDTAHPATTPQPTTEATSKPTPKPTGRPTGAPTGKPATTGRPSGGPGATETGARDTGARDTGGRDTGACRSASGGGQGATEEQAAADVERARAALERAADAVRGTRIVAPAAGTVLEVAGDVGDAAGTGAFVSLGDLTEPQVRAMVTESDVGRLALGQRARITLATRPGEERAGRIIGVAPTAAVSGRLVRYAVTLAFDEPPAGLLVGQTASVTVTTDTAPDAVHVPVQAVRSRADGASVVTVRSGGRDTARVVSTGVRSDRYVEITSGLAESDQVVMAGAATGEFPDPAWPRR